LQRNIYRWIILLDFANGNYGVEAKSDESKSSKNEHVTYRKFKTILDISVFSTKPGMIRSKFNMISKATLENAKGGPLKSQLN
jgi:hypothetical protein